ncbi:hypothetical protein SOM08_14995 [Hydrogenophaga sp. SNF1]|nr:hypothetical protein [Hydrogenophaga sp. SNF1]WQB82305.1 hypothetical protein SOM08_14995 [Hydrogenophaga sp. SNF1]
MSKAGPVPSAASPRPGPSTWANSVAWFHSVGASGSEKNQRVSRWPGT